MRYTGFTPIPAGALEYSSWYGWRRIKRGREESRGLKGFRDRLNLASWKSLR